MKSSSLLVDPESRAAWMESEGPEEKLFLLYPAPRSCSCLSFCLLTHVHAGVFYPKAAFQHVLKSSPVSL